MVFEPNLEGGRRILKVRATAEWSIVSRAKTKMGKGQKKKNIEDSEKCRHLAGVQGPRDERPGAGS